LIGFPDCEAFGSGLISQPTAAFTSLAFVVAGIWLIGDRRLAYSTAPIVFGATIAAVGIGSFLDHAAITEWARHLDSLAIKLMLVAFIAYPAARMWSWEPPAYLASWAGSSALVVLIELIWPPSANAMLGVLAVVAIGGAVSTSSPLDRRWLLAGLSLLGAGWVAWWLGRQGGPMCAPWAVFQLHGVWHILAAVGVASLYQVYRSETT
ncbi:MAG: hypothetical protein GY773_19745, partial [Actinomycetia bacterium]|nr:hypothetical protein [Actinomycetes bacterium]